MDRNVGLHFLSYTLSLGLSNDNENILREFSIITHHIDGIYWTDAVDKHVCVNHCGFDCKEAQENPF